MGGGTGEEDESGEMVRATCGSQLLGASCSREARARRVAISGPQIKNHKNSLITYFILLHYCCTTPYQAFHGTHTSSMTCPLLSDSESTT